MADEISKTAPVRLPRDQDLVCGALVSTEIKFRMIIGGEKELVAAGNRRVDETEKFGAIIGKVVTTVVVRTFEGSLLRNHVREIRILRIALEGADIHRTNSVVLMITNRSFCRDDADG